MELELDVLSSLSVKSKKPWHKFSWLEETEPPHGLYLFSDGSRVGQLSLSSGKIRRKFPTLSSIKDRIALTATSPSGSLVGGLLLEGDLFIWDKWKDLLLTFVTPLSRMGTEKMPTLKGTRLFLSDSGEQALMISCQTELYLWELMEHRSLWWKLFPPRDIQLPKSGHREMTVEAAFHASPVLGECCTCVFVYTDHSTGEMVITNLFINWPTPSLKFYSRFAHKHDSEPQRSGLLGYPFVTPPQSKQTKDPENSRHVRFKEDVVRSQSSEDHKREHSGRVMSVPLQDLTNTSATHSTKQPSSILTKSDTPHTYFDQLSSQEPLSPFETSWSTVRRRVTSTHHTPLTSSTSAHSTSTHPTTLTGRGSYVCRLSPLCTVGALATNCPEAADTEVVFFSPLARAELGVQVYPRETQGLLGRTFWVSDMAWTADGLLLVCMTKRGSLMILPKFGPPLRLIARGCSIEMGPTHFLPLHPLITVIGVSRKVTDHETSESSERDTLRQRFSVTTHPHLPILLCSDGYSLTILKLPATLSLPTLLSGLVSSARDVLALPPIEIKGPSLSASHSQTKSLQLQSLHDIAASFTDTTGLGDTLGSSVSSAPQHAGGYMPALSGVEGGGIHFAGLGSTLQLPTPTSDVQLSTAMANLLSAWGMLLTCGVTMPGDGVPVQGSPGELDSQLCSLEDITSILLLSILKILELLHERAKDAHARDSLRYFLHSLLSVVPFDSISQRHLNTVTALANRVLTEELRKCLKKHHSLKENLTQQAWIEYINSMNRTVSETSDLLDTIIAFMEYTYDYTPINRTMNCFCTPSLLQTDIASQHTNSCLSTLSPAGSLLAKVSEVFQEDVNKCEQTVKQQISQAVSESRLQSREMNVLYNQLTKCLNKALVTLQYARTQTRWISPTHGNPITSNVFKSHKVQKLVSKIEVYDIQGALEYVHSLVNYSEVAALDHCSLKLSTSVRTVVHLFCQVMASFFSDKAPFITTSLNSFHQLSLSRAKLSKATQSEALFNFWTADHVVELLMISQFWLEACTFLQMLGEWKKAFFLSSVLVQHGSLMRTENQQHSMLKQLAQNIITENLLRCIGLKFMIPFCKTDPKRLSCLPGLSDSHLMRRDIIGFVPECLRLCAQAEMDGVLLTVVASLVSEIAHCCRKMCVEVPSGLYLPAPPLFCPQPATQNEEFIQCPVEYKLRHKLSTLIRCLVLVLSSSNTLLPCAQWYCSQLEQHLSTDDVSSLCLPGDNHCELPQGLSELAHDDTTVHFSDQDGGTVKVLLGVFRELCGLLWFLHVRDQFSAHLRQLQPSPLKEASPDRVVQEASLWGARYLSFTKFLENHSSNLLQGATLSIFSELETSVFLADILAHCFPSGTPRSSTKEKRLTRLVSKLRSAQGTESEALSVRYQTKSQVIVFCQEKLGENQGNFCELVLPEGNSYLIEKSALCVGSFSFEYDSKFIEFLDNFFSVILPEKPGSTILSPHRENSLLTVSQLHLSSSFIEGANLPSLASFLSKLKHVNKELASWEQVIPLLESLHSWSCTTSPSVAPSRPGTQRQHRKKPKGRKMEPEQRSSASLKVSISPKLVLKCLQQREDREHLSVHQSITTTVVADQEVQGDTSIAAASEHQEEVREKESLLEPTEDVDVGSKSSQCREASGTRATAGPPLIQIPPGTLEGHISGDDLMRTHVHTHSSHSLPVLTVDGLETEAEDSLSTGELPSALSFSVGERRLKNVTTTDDVQLTETLTEISEAVTLSFNDFVLPTSSSSNKSTLATPPDHPPIKERTQEEKVKEIEEVKQYTSTPLVQDSSVEGDQHKTEMVDLDSTRNAELEQTTGTKEVPTNNETRNELERVDGNEEVDTDDSGTFTVSSSTTLLHELSSQHSIELDTTLQAVASTSNNLPSSQPPPAVQAHAELNLLPSTPSIQPMDKSSSGVQACSEPNQLPRSSVDVSIAVGTQRSDEQAITSIVRTEMKEILELQQQNLMTLLKVVEAKAAQKEVHSSSIDCGTQKDFDVEVHVDSEQLSTELHDKGPASHDVHVQEKSSEFIVPTLNMEDLLSPTETSYSNPPPSEDSADSHDNLQNAKNESQPNQKHSRDQYVQTINTNLNGSASGSKFGSSELTTVVNSPGALPQLSHSSSTSTDLQGAQSVRATGHQIMSTPKPSRTHVPAPVMSQLSRIGQPGSGVDLPLLQLDCTVNDGQANQQQQENRLEVLYPDLARNLSFMSSQPISSVPTAPSGAPQQLASTPQHTSYWPVLLSLPDLHQKSEMGPGVYSHSPSLPHNEPLPFPLPSPVPHPHKQPSFFPQPSQAPHTHNQPPSFPRPAPAPLSHNQPPSFPRPAPAPHTHNRPSSFPHSHKYPPAHPHKHPSTSPHPSPVHRGPPLLSLPPHLMSPHHSPPHQPTSTHTAPPSLPITKPLPNQPQPYFLPNVPLIPFVPKLLPSPTATEQAKGNASSKGPPLLIATDPLAAMKQNGVKLLELPKSDPPEMMRLDVEPVSSKAQESSNNADSITDSQLLLLEKEGPGVKSVPDSCLDREKKKKVHRSGKKPRRKVVWEQKEQSQVETKLEEPPITEHQIKECPSSDIESQTTEVSVLHTELVPEIQNEQVTDVSQESPSSPQRTIHTVPSSPQRTIHTVPDGPSGLRKPNFDAQSQRHYPEEIPLESLLVRRLNLQAQLGHTQPPTGTPIDTSVSTSTLSGDRGTQSSIDANNEESSLCSISECSDSKADTVPPLSLKAEVHTAENISMPSRKPPALKHSEPSNGVFHPPVLALNVSEPLPPDLSSLSTVSLSSTVTLTETDQSERRVDHPEIALTETVPADNVSQSLPAKDQVSHHLPEHSDHDSVTSVSLSVDNNPPAHLDKIKKLGALTKPGTVTSTALKRLEELEEQLNAIENTAKTVEGEFKSSKQILHTIDQLQLVTAPISDAESALDSVSLDLQSIMSDDSEHTPSHTQGEAGTDRRNDGNIEFFERSEKRVQFQFQDKPNHKQQASDKLPAEQASMKKGVGPKKVFPTHTQGTGSWNKDEIREWMRDKRKQRLAEFRQQKESQRRMEKHPFKPPAGEMVTKVQSLRAEKQKRERQQDFVNKRIDDAFALMNDMLTAKPSLESKPSRSSPTRNVETRIQPSDDSHTKSVFPPKPSSSPAHSVLVKDVGRGKKGQNREAGGGYKSRKKETSFTGTYVKTSNQSHTDKLSCNSTPKRLSSSSARKLSSVEGLTKEEQLQIADILASTVYDGSSISSGSILTDIDWNEVDKLLDS